MPSVTDTARAFMPYPDVPVAHAASGPLSGLTFAVKDLFHVAGYPTSGGQPLLLAMNGIAARTAPTVQRLLDAGARFVGKVLTDELAFSINGNNAHFGAPLNGAAPERITGGSSCGSASAVSNGLADVALGTDTGGSVRIPASHCGLVGIRPSQGRVSLLDCLDLSPSFDTCGWFARNLDVFSRVADVLLGADSPPLPAAVRLLQPTDLWDLLTPEVNAALAPVLRRCSAALGEAKAVQLLPEGEIDALFEHYRSLQGHEAWVTRGEFITRYQPPLGPGVAERFAFGKSVTASQLAVASAYRAGFSQQMRSLLASDGVLVLPTMPDVAPLRSDPEPALDSYRQRAMRLLCVAGMAGLPQVSLPWATRLGAPLGVSLVGPPGSDRSLVALAARIGAAH